MKKLGAVVTTILLSISLPFVLYAGEAKKKEAQAMVKKAITYIKENGREKAFAEFNNPKGKFTDKDLYIFVDDSKGKILAHGVFPEWAGKSPAEIKDPNLIEAVNKILKFVKKSDKGWVKYKFYNPLTKKIESKQSYVEKFEDIIVGCGVYVK
jgi:cytochrome c